jgi:2',3'-cyclic-nucleotide 2'-phosphodiesterase (5'-nucleotidase family)
MSSLGDLHDGNGLSDAALPNGVDSNPIFDEIDYDLLTIGQSAINSSEHF